MKQILTDIKNILLALIITIIYPVLMNQKTNIIETINLLLIITLCVCACNIIVSYYSDKKYLSNVYKYLSISFLGSGIVGFGYTYLIKNSYFTQGFWKTATGFNTVFSLYESLALMYCFKTKKHIKPRTYLILTAIATMPISFIGINYIEILQLIFSTQYVEIVRLMSRIIAFVLKIYLLKIVISNEEISSSNVQKYFVVFVAARIVLHIFGFIVRIPAGSSILIICCLMLLVANYCIVKIMLVEVIRNPQEFIYKDLVQKTRELENTIADLKEANNQKEAIRDDYERKTEEEKIKNEILANISHEFKTPINVIYAAVQTLELKNNNESGKEGPDYSFIIRQNCNRLIRLVNNFIDVTRFDSGEIQVNLENRNIVELTEEIVSSVTHYAESKNLNLIFDTSKEELYCYVDAALYERLILNILSNSIKYTNIAGNITITVYENDKKVRIILEDQGIGISKENLKRIFNRFERADKTFSRDTEGSGLGLTIAKKIVEVLNGEIEIFSKEKEGTRVSITLPQSHVKPRDREKAALIKDNIKHKADIEMSDIYFT